MTLLRAALSCLAILACSACALAQSAPPPAGNVTMPSGAENLKDLRVDLHSMPAQQPIPGGTGAGETYTTELLQMQWRSGDPIDVFIIRPKGVARPPVSIFLYGFPDSDSRFRNDAFCRLVTRGGAAAIGFVPALTGQRYHSVPMREWFISRMHDAVVESVHDVQMVINYAATRSDLDTSRIAIFGQGAGATIAGLAATVDKRIGAVDLLDPWGDWPAWMAKSTLIPEDRRAELQNPKILAGLAPLDPLVWLPSLANQPLKLDDALYETNTPAEAKQHIEAALPKSAVLIRYSSRAQFESEAVADGKMLAWLEQQLAKPAHAQAIPPAGSAQPAPAEAATADGRQSFTSFPAAPPAPRHVAN